MAIYKKYQTAYQTLIDGIDQDGFEDCEYYNPENPIVFCYHRFIKEYDHEVKRFGLHKALVNWLQGLALNIPYTNGEIMKKFNLNEKQVDRYWDFMAMRLKELFQKEKLI